MDRRTIMFTVNNNLCCGCGTCVGICPKDCISWKRTQGLFVPQVDEQRCVECGICAAVCPGLGHTYSLEHGSAMEKITGTVLECRNAWSKDPRVRHTSASGGVVTTMIRKLLDIGAYDGAFCLDTYDYHMQLKTKFCGTADFSGGQNLSTVPKSRYLPVSHENAVRYIKNNRNARLVFVGTSCAIRGLQLAVEKLGLEREQYLFVGLFCDKVFNYNVLKYFEDTYAAGETIPALHFKNKESGGWPGDMKFIPGEIEPFYVSFRERAKAKPYFMPERCLYCVDKLNVCADISLGDNYTGKDESKLGSNSVIIRTEKGRMAWSAVEDALEIRDVTVREIQKGQYLDGRLNHLYYAGLKSSSIGVGLELNSGIQREMNCHEFIPAWKDCLNRITAGAVYDIRPDRIRKQIYKDNKKPNQVTIFVRRVRGYVQRKLK